MATENTYIQNLVDEVNSAIENTARAHTLSEAKMQELALHFKKVFIVQFFDTLNEGAYTED